MKNVIKSRNRPRPTRRETPSGVANGATGAMSKRRESGTEASREVKQAKFEQRYTSIRTIGRDT
jgi:hypothetical protein